MPGEKQIYTPFEKEYEVEQVRTKTGIPLKQHTIEELLKIKEEQQLTQFDFPQDER